MLLELKRPVVCLLETLQSQGGVPLAVHHSACPEYLQPALEKCPVVPFHREPGFKEATIRLVLQELLPCVAQYGALPDQSKEPVYLPNEATRGVLVLPKRVRQYHVYVSRHNAGAGELMKLLQAEQGRWNEGELTVTTSSPAQADFWLLHLSR